MKEYIYLVLLFTFLVCFPFAVFADTTHISVSFDSNSATFKTGQKQLVNMIFSADSGISAARIVVSSSKEIKIHDILSPVDDHKVSLTDTKLVGKKISAKQAEGTILLLKNTDDLPKVLIVPLVVEGTHEGVATIQLDQAKTQILDGNGNSIPLQLSSASTITFSNQGISSSLPTSSMSIHLKTKLQGINPGQAKGKIIAGFSLQVVQKNGSSQRAYPPITGSLIIGEDGMAQGSFPVTAVKPGDNFRLLVKGPVHLQKRICTNSPTEKSMGSYVCNTFGVALTQGENIIDASGMTLMAGDISSQDGILNSYDFSLMRKGVIQADVNFDGSVDQKDYDMLTYTLSKTSGFDQK